jgi:hypothetical protein
MRALFLQAPSFDGFDGGAGSRYQSKREIRSFWYPTWLAQPAALVENSKLTDAPPHGTSLAEVVAKARNFDLAVLHTSTPSFTSDVNAITALKANPALKAGLIGAKAAVDAEGALSLRLGPLARVQRARLKRAGVAAPDQVFGLAWSGAMTQPRLAGLIEHLARRDHRNLHPSCDLFGLRRSRAGLSL